MAALKKVVHFSQTQHREGPAFEIICVYSVVLSLLLMESVFYNTYIQKEVVSVVIKTVLSKDCLQLFGSGGVLKCHIGK